VDNKTHGKLAGYLRTHRANIWERLFYLFADAGMSHELA